MLLLDSPPPAHSVPPPLPRSRAPSRAQSALASPASPVLTPERHAEIVALQSFRDDVAAVVASVQVSTLLDPEAAQALRYLRFRLVQADAQLKAAR